MSPRIRKFPYKAEYAEMLREHMKKGNSFKSFALIVGCSYVTIHRWTIDFKDFGAVKKACDYDRAMKDWSWRG